MSDFLTNIWTFKTSQFTVSVDAEVEYEPIVGQFSDEKQEQDVIRRVASGEYVYFCAKASVTFQGTELAVDYLGSCIYGDYDEFRDHLGIGYYATRKHYLEAVKAHQWLKADYYRRGLILFAKQGSTGIGSYFSGMVKQVCQDARKAIQDHKKTYSDLYVRVKQ